MAKQRWIVSYFVLFVCGLKDQEACEWLSHDIQLGNMHTMAILICKGRRESRVQSICYRSYRVYDRSSGIDLYLFSGRATSMHS